MKKIVKECPGCRPKGKGKLSKGKRSKKWNGEDKIVVFESCRAHRGKEEYERVGNFLVKSRFWPLVADMFTSPVLSASVI